MIEVVVAAKTLEAEDIISLELASADGTALPAFEPGAHIDVHLSNDMIRQYSLCNPCDETDRYKICVLKDPDSRGGSIALHNQVEVNDRLRISEPRNLFPMAAEAKRSLLFAGGIGITPLLGMAQTLAAENSDFELHYSGRDENKMAFIDQLSGSSFSERVHLHISHGDPSRRLNADPILTTPETGTHIYVCGPVAFMEYVLDRAVANGWPSSQLHREYFSGAQEPQSEEGSFEVEIKSTGQVFQVPPGRTALHVLEDAGFDIPVSCEEGICGTCLTRVLEGEPDHRDLFMTEEERALNDKFTPCCSRARSGRLVLDL